MMNVKPMLDVIDKKGSLILSHKTVNLWRLRVLDLITEKEYIIHTDETGTKTIYNPDHKSQYPDPITFDPFDLDFLYDGIDSEDLQGLMNIFRTNTGIIS